MAIVMAGRWRIEPVPRTALDEALRFLVCGRSRQPAVAARAEAFAAMARDGGRRTHLWWTRQWGRMRAVAMVVEMPGRAGMVFYSPPGAVGVRTEALAALLRALSAKALEGGNAFLQATSQPGDDKAAEVLAAAGYDYLAELISMRLELPAAPAVERPTTEGPWRFRSAESFAEDELGKVIVATYEGSLDCPALRGLRSADDIIAAHKANGVFTPATWWIAARHDDPAGCILVNDHSIDPVAVVVYLGVLEAHRGQGLARAMIRRAAAVAQQRRRAGLTLAVDDRNHFAKNVYVSEGFYEIERRIAFLITPRALKKQAS